MTSTDRAPAPRWFLQTLVYAGLTSAIVSSLGMLLVPSVAGEFGITVSAAQWMLTVNLLVGAVATPIMGRMADGPHTRRLLLASLAVIFTGSVIATVATSFTVFLIGRALQGLLYGTVPVTIALARRHLSYSESQPAISTLSVTVSVGMGLGYPLTGLLAAGFGHRSAFAFAALFVATAAAAVWRFVPAGPDPLAPRTPLDLPGTVLLGAGLATLLLWISEAQGWGWTSPRALSTLAVALAALSMWVVHSVRTRYPLINLRVVRRPEVLLANATAIGLGTALYIGLSIASLVAQAPAGTGFGLAVPLMWAGFMMAPLSVGSFLANRAVRALARRVDMAVFLPVGAAVMTVASLLLWSAHDNFLTLAVGMFLFGAGIGSGYAAMPALIARSVAVDQLGSAVSFNQVLRTVGGAVGAALSAAVLAAHPSESTYSTDEGITMAFGVGVLCCAAVMVALTWHAIMRRRRGGASHGAGR
ncbi:MFS transporter [Dietzia natronolimnaea]|uniref:MFS transporter n=1 Tax=Dietzia natronolimnaea TaxID=161920 RepID=A0A2A2WMX5_9ACTN|nr:MFS transporter [Dietzia natronolimnaea]PAY22548.1 MFS transporter [Dietzia natronolimnaea]